MDNNINFNVETSIYEIINEVMVPIRVKRKDNNMTRSMASSNYPPGVSGNEYEIAGADSEWEELEDCNGEIEIMPIPYDSAEAIVDAIKSVKDLDDIEDLKATIRFLQSAVENFIDTSITITCPLDEEVYKESYRGITRWECPICGKAYEVDNSDY